jgi:hypothetical protein
VIGWQLRRQPITKNNIRINPYRYFSGMCEKITLEVF